MPETTCPKCGQPIQGDACAKCGTISDSAIREGEPPVLPRMLEPWPFKRESAPAGGCGWVSYLIVGFLSLTAIFLLMPAPQRFHVFSERTVTVNNMKQIGLACHFYHDVNKHLPTPRMTTVEQGNERLVQLSWRVAILPYIEQDLLFKNIDKTVGWDHPVNVRFREPIPPVYLCTYRENNDPTKMTPFQYFTGPDTLFPDNLPRRIQDIPDETSKTFLFAEANQTVTWTRPADMTIRPDEPLPLPKDRFLAAMVDGSIRMVMRDKTNDTILRHLIHPNDGKPNADWEN